MSLLFHHVLCQFQVLFKINQQTNTFYNHRPCVKKGEIWNQYRTYVWKIFSTHVFSVISCLLPHSQVSKACDSVLWILAPPVVMWTRPDRFGANFTQDIPTHEIVRNPRWPCDRCVERRNNWITGKCANVRIVGEQYTWFSFSLRLLGFVLSDEYSFSPRLFLDYW